MFPISEELAGRRFCPLIPRTASGGLVECMTDNCVFWRWYEAPGPQLVGRPAPEPRITVARPREGARPAESRALPIQDGVCLAVPTISTAVNIGLSPGGPR